DFPSAGNSFPPTPARPPRERSRKYTLPYLLHEGEHPKNLNISSTNPQFTGVQSAKIPKYLISISSGKDLSVMWKPTNQPNTPPARPAEQERPSMPTTTSPVSEPPATPRPMSSATADQAT